MILARPALEALTDQAFAATADGRQHQRPVTIAGGQRLAALLAEQFGGTEETAGRAVMAVAIVLGPILAQYEDFPGGISLVPAVLALAAEQVVREAGEPS